MFFFVFLGYTLLVLYGLYCFSFCGCAIWTIYKEHLEKKRQNSPEEIMRRYFPYSANKQIKQVSRGSYRTLTYDLSPILEANESDYESDSERLYGKMSELDELV